MTTTMMNGDNDNGTTGHDTGNATTDNDKC